MSANFVARELRYNMTKGWGEGATATAEFFRPLETFSERFEALLAEVAALGFTAMDLWTGHLDPEWATPAHISQAAALLVKHGLEVPSMATWVSDNPVFLENLAKIANGVGARVIGGGCAAPLLAEKRSDFVAYLEKYNLVYGFENHPEKSAEEVLAKIGDSEGGRIGVAIDTGWYGTQGCDAPNAIRQFAGRLVHVHLKDIRPPHIATETHDIRTVEKGQDPTLKDMGHETCILGDGVVQIENCVVAAREVGYTGFFSIEHEPEDHSPIEDVRVGLERLKAWRAS